MAMAVRRQRLLVGAEAELGRLQALRDEALDRPGVDELAARLRRLGALGVALGDVDALDADALHQRRPVLAGLRLAGRDAGVAGDVEQRLLDEPGHHAGVGAAAVHRGDAARPAAAQVEHALAERIVRALRQRELRVVVEARPRLGDGVDVVGVEVLAEVHQVDRGGVDRDVDDHAAARPGVEQRGQHLAVVRLGQADLHELELALVQQPAVGVDRVDHHELRAVERDVPLQQRQGAAADRAEADHHDRAVEAGVNGVVGHWSLLQTRWRLNRQGGRTEQTPRGIPHGVHEFRDEGYAALGCGSVTRPATAATSGVRDGCFGARIAPRTPSSAPAHEFAAEQTALVGKARQPQPAGPLGREAEAAVVGRVADQQHGAVAAPGRGPQRMAHQAEPMPRRRCAGSTASGPSSSAERSGPAETSHSRTVPTTRPSSTATNDSPRAGARPARSRSRRLLEADRAIGERRAAPRGRRRRTISPGEWSAWHSPSFPCPLPLAARVGEARAEPPPQAGEGRDAVARCQMWMVFSGAKPLKATAA